jgi:hypothetical protein
VIGGIATAPHSERLLLFASGLLVAVGTGVFVATSDFVWVLAVLCVIVAAALVVSQQATFWFTLIMGVLVVGVCQLYVPNAGYLKYVPPLAACGLLLHVFAHWLKRPFRDVPATVPWFLGFLVISLISMGANWSGFGMAVVGLKSYYPMWMMFLALALIPWNPRLIDSIPRVALVLALLQLPFVAHQFLYLVPMRESIRGVVAVDIVSGTFGGDPFGGGANAVLTLFLVTVSACLLGMWRTGAISGLTACLGVIVMFVPILLNSSRAALLYLPLVFCIIFSSGIRRNPLRAIAGMLVTATLVIGMLTTYTMLSQTPGTHTWQDMVTSAYEGQLASERERADNYSGLSRWTVLTFWLDQQKRYGPVEMLIGHGPGASRVQDEGLDLAETLAEKRYAGRQIGYTAVAAMLWEVGVAGLAVMLGLFWAAFRQAGWLARYYEGWDPYRAGIAHGLRAATVVVTISLAHKDFLAFHVPFQTFLVVMLGYMAAQTNLIRHYGHQPDRRALQAGYG